jgi:hypothetical protein
MCPSVRLSVGNVTKVDQLNTKVSGSLLPPFDLPVEQAESTTSRHELRDSLFNVEALSNVAFAGSSAPKGEANTPVDIQKIMQAKAADVTLQDGDILFVPHSGGRRPEEYLQLEAEGSSDGWLLRRQS